MSTIALPEGWRLGGPDTAGVYYYLGPRGEAQWEVPIPPESVRVQVGPPPPASLPELHEQLLNLQYSLSGVPGARGLRSKEDFSERLEASKLAPPKGSELEKLLRAMAKEEGKPAGFSDTLSYFFTLNHMVWVSFFHALDIARLAKDMSFNSPSVGHRMRLRNSLINYSVAVRASVGAQTLIRRSRDEFCARHSVSLDKVIEELRLPMPQHIAAGGAQAQAEPSKDPNQNVRFGNDIAEARCVVEQMLVSDMVSSQLIGIDYLIVFLATLFVLLVAAAATALVFWYNPATVLSSAGAAPLPPCALTFVNSTGGVVCVRPAASLVVDDGTSLYRANIYIAIVLVMVPILSVAVSGLTLKFMLGSVSALLDDIDNSQAELLFKYHPKNPFRVRSKQAGGGDAKGQEGRAQRLFERSSFERMRARAIRDPFRKEILLARDSLLTLEDEDFSSTYNMMRRDVASAASLVGANVSTVMLLITQFLGALSVFLIVVQAITNAGGQRFVVVALFAGAAVWVYVLGSMTLNARVYAFLVLAESTKYLNTVLHVDQYIGSKTVSAGGCCGGAAGAQEEGKLNPLAASAAAQQWEEESEEEGPGEGL